MCTHERCVIQRSCRYSSPCILARFIRGRGYYVAVYDGSLSSRLGEAPLPRARLSLIARSIEWPSSFGIATSAARAFSRRYRRSVTRSARGRWFRSRIPMDYCSRQGHSSQTLPFLNQWLAHALRQVGFFSALTFLRLFPRRVLKAVLPLPW